MADIDKSLPNEVKKTIEIEGPEKRGRDHRRNSRIHSKSRRHGNYTYKMTEV